MKGEGREERARGRCGGKSGEGGERMVRGEVGAYEGVCGGIGRGREV